MTTRSAVRWLARWGWTIPLVLAIAASASSLANGFAFDDTAIIRGNARVHSLAGWWRLFGQTYWPPELGASMYRPLTMLGFALQWAIGDGRPLPFHVVSVLLYGALCVAMHALARRMLPAIAALVAASLFAVHPVHVEAVANIVGQAELLVALPIVLACVRWIDARRQGGPRTADVAWILLLYAVAALSKEHGMLLPGFVALAELCIVRDARPLARRARALALPAAALAIAGVALFLVRLPINGAFGHDSRHLALVGTTAVERVWMMLAIVPQWVRLLVWPAQLSADYSPPMIPIVRGPDPVVIPGVLALVVALALALTPWRGRRLVTFALLWCALALALFTNVVVVTGVLVAERALLLASVGVALLAGTGLVAWRARARRPAHSRLAMAALAVIVGLGLVRSLERGPVWRDSNTLFEQTVRDAPLGYNAHYLWGDALFQLKRPAEGAAEMLVAMRLFDRDSDVAERLAIWYRNYGRCDQAIPYYQRALALVPGRRVSRLDLAACLIEQGRVADARAVIAEGRRWRPADRTLLSLEARADSLSAMLPQ